jgi:hypothetical protein
MATSAIGSFTPTMDETTYGCSCKQGDGAETGFKT